MNGVRGLADLPDDYDFVDDPLTPHGLLRPPLDRDVSSSEMLDHDAFKGKGKAPERYNAVLSSMLDQLPSTIIQKILWTVDANGFASLCLINRRWYQESQKIELYAHHLSRCPSFALMNNVITGPFRKYDLFRLKTKFAAEVRRNLFDAYLKPRETRVNLISITANSSTAFPGGEAFRFEFSPNGRTILALSSSRIYVLNATADSLVVQRELKTLRRPIAAAITDDGSLLAVLSSRLQANIYGLTPGDEVKHLQVIGLENPPRTIAIAHEGTVLAAAYEGGVEVFSLAVNALSTDRRAVRSEAVDSLTFSVDGSMLVGSSQNLQEPGAVVITAPFYTENDPNITAREIHSHMWTTQILFPQISSTCSHAALLPGHSEGDTYWLFAYDHMLMTYRAVRTDDTRTGVAYFLTPPTSRRFSFPSPTIAPAVTACGTLVTAGYSDGGLWLYGIPERLDVSPDMGSVVERNEEFKHGRMALTSATGNPEPLLAYSPSISGSSEEIEEDSLAGKVDWRQSLFVKCTQLKTIPGYTCCKWVEQSENVACAFDGKRLIMVAPGGVNSLTEDLGEERMPVDGSRICLLDFDYSPSLKENREITIEVGDNEPELLTEQLGNMDTEVAIERRRTVRANRTAAASNMPLGRSVTNFSHGQTYFENSFRRSNASPPSSPNDEPMTPYSRVSSNSGLHRAATAAGFLHARYPPRPPLGTSNSGPGGARRSIDSWESPPPPYSNDGSRSPPIRNRQASLDASRNYSSVHNDHARLGPSRTAYQSNQRMHSYPQNTASGINIRSDGIRQDMTMDGSPTSDAMPSARPRSDYGGLANSSRARGLSDTGLVTVAEGSIQQQDFFHGLQHSQANITPISPEDAVYNRFRSSTHDTMSSESTLGMRPTLTHPMSPPILEIDAWQHGSDSSGGRSPVATRADNRLSLTGANLQNRLNHPVPPVPEEIQQPASSTAVPARPVRSVEPAEGPYGATQGMAPAMPTSDQLANLNRRMAQRPPSVLVPGYTGMSASRDFGGVPHSPPRGAWGAAGVPGSPSFNRAIATPNGLSRSGSRGSGHAVPASYSAPNLLSQARPPYGRLDTIESISSNYAQVDRERSHSLVHNGQDSILENNLLAGERRVESDPTSKKSKKSKKRKEENIADGKKSSRCVVM